MKSSFLNLKAKSECFFMFEFHNNWISFSALIKYVSTLTKFLSAHHVYCIFESAYCIQKIFFLHKLFLVFYIKLFSVQHYIKNCSLSFLRKFFYVHCLKIVRCFLIKHLVKSGFLNLNTKSKCFFMFEFHNDWIYFSTLIKSVSTLIKFALCTSCVLYIQIYLLLL